MNPARKARRAFASRLIESYCDGEEPSERAAAAACVYERLSLCLTPLVGARGVRALFTRSVALTTGEFPFLAGVDAEQSVAVDTLRAALQGQEAEAILHGATALFGAFLWLLATYVGEQLTAQVLRSAWPEIGEMPPKETK